MSNKVDGLSVSPDGRRFALSVAGATDNESHIWTMDSDGANARQLTTSTGNESDPVWVGDSGWLLLRQGVSSGLGGYDGCPTLYLVNSGATHILELGRKESTDIKIVTYKDPDSQSGTLVACPFSAVAWISGQ